MSNYFENHFLIAMPSLLDPTFHRSVAYIYEHNEDGALGIVINKPMKITLGDVLQHLSIPTTTPHVQTHPVLLGGPVAQEQGFLILPTSAYDSEDAPIAESEEIIVSSSKIMLQAIAKGKGPKDIIISLGYSCWEAGQLENEIINNSWLIAPLSSKILFDTPFEKRWHAAATSIGVDVSRLSNEAGHA